MRRSSRHVSSPTPSFTVANTRGSIRLGSILITVGLLVTLVLAGVVLAPQAVEYLDGTTTEVDPPEAGDRDPAVTDPDDPGDTTYETSEETVHASDVEMKVHELVNEERAEHGLDALEFDGTVASVSRAHSQDMYEHDALSHVNQDDETPFERFQDVADYCHAYGENIARTSLDTTVERDHDGQHVEYTTAEDLAEGVVNQWMHSEEHRAAVLEEDIDGGDQEISAWDRGGVGIYLGMDGDVFATHNFCTLV